MTGDRLALDRVPGLAALLSRQAGLARRDQLRGLGVTKEHVRWQCAAGRWRVVSPTVVAADNGRLDDEQRRWLAVLHAPCAWLGGRTALATRGLTGFEPALIHVLVPRDRRPGSVPGVAWHVSARLPPAADGLALPCTSIPRATVDGAAWERWPRAAAGLVLAVLQQRLTTPEAILAELDEAGRVRHRRVVRDAVADATGGAEAVSEVDVAPLIRRAGLPEPRRQTRRAGRHDLEVDLPDGRVLVIEVDGPTHATDVARWRDSGRDLDLAVDGVLSMRIPPSAIRHDAVTVVARLRAVADACRRRRDSAGGPPGCGVAAYATTPGRHLSRETPRRGGASAQAPTQ